MDVTWDGVIQAGIFVEREEHLRFELVEAADRCDWQAMFEYLEGRDELINVVCPGDHMLNTILHRVAMRGSAVEVAHALVRRGGWRTLRNRDNDRPVDVAKREGHEHLISILTPSLKHSVAIDKLNRIQTHFHGLIRRQVDALVQNQDLRLPELEPLLEIDPPRMWFPVPGMYGGFSYELRWLGSEPRLDVESWWRVISGSEQQHVVTASGARPLPSGAALSN